MRSFAAVVALCVSVAAPLLACSTEPQPEADPGACQELKACCAGLPEGQKKKDCSQLVPTSTSGNLCRANVQTYCGDGGAVGITDASSEGGATASDGGGGSADCPALKKQCESCASANGKSSCESLVNQDDATACKAALDQQLFGAEGSACQQ